MVVARLGYVAKSEPSADAVGCHFSSSHNLAVMEVRSGRPQPLSQAFSSWVHHCRGSRLPQCGAHGTSSSEELRPGDLDDPVSEPEQRLPPTLRQQQPRPLRPETLS